MGIPARRACIGTVLCLALAVALVAAATATARTSRHCSGEIRAGRPPSASLNARDLAVSDLGCDPARSLVRAYLSLKLHQSSERCAGLAEDPPYKGCIVHGYRCRATSRPHVRHGRVDVDQLCSDGRRAIRFVENDTSAP